MAYDEGLAQRIRDVLGKQPGLVEKKMFGGIGFMVHGNMACGVHKDALVVRVGPEGYEEALAKPHTRPFDMTGRPMKGWDKVFQPTILNRGTTKARESRIERSIQNDRKTGRRDYAFSRHGCP